MGFSLFVVALLAALLYIFFNQKRVLHTISITGATFFLVISFLLTRDIIVTGAPYSSGFIYIDALSIIILDIVLFIGWVGSVYGAGYLEEELKRGKINVRKIKFYYFLMALFNFSMILVLTAKNMGVMWVGIETTTLASVFLVSFYERKRDLEAAWKYVIICSVGIALALLGIIFLHLSSVSVLGAANLLSWPDLFTHAEALSSPILKLAFIFILVGFGTKAGLAPMHTWLPDAHSQAPSPVSALLSGVLLNTSMYGIIRTVIIINKNLGGSSYTGTLLIVLGIISMLIAGISMLTQRDYKRMLAYSSIEHMGIIAVALGFFTPASIWGGLFHMINHSLTKSVLFFASGNIFLRFRTKQTAGVSGLLRALPLTGTVFFLGLFAIAGMPPFSVFISEFSIIAAIFAEGDMFLGAAMILLLGVVFVAIALVLFRMFFGEDSSAENSFRENPYSNVLLMLVLFIVLAGGLFLPTEISQLITQARDIIIGG